MSQPVLYLLMGLPGAGKTTVANHLEALTGAVRLTSDEVRFKLWRKPRLTEDEHQALYRHLNSTTKSLLQQGKSVIYDANLNRLCHRQEKYDLARKLGVSTQLFWVRTPRLIARKRRIDAREHHHLVPKHETPSKMFDRVAQLIESPRYDEPYTELDGTKLTEQCVQQGLNKGFL